MSTTEQLTGLLFQIRDAASPLHKLKLTALAWRTLRGLSRHDRLVVAKEIGLGGAEHLVEQLGSRGGLSPAALLTAIRRAEEAEPEELAELLEGVMDPTRRDELLAGALRSAGEYLADPGGPVPEDESERELDVDDVRSESPDEAESVAGAVEEQLSPTPATEELQLEAEPIEVAASDAATSAVPTRGEEDEEVAKEVMAAPADHQPPPPVAPPSPWQPRASRISVHVPVRSVPTVALAGRLKSQPSTLARLRLMRSSGADLREMSIDELVEVLSVFAGGWSRRRALEGLLRRGIPADLEEAVELVRRVSDSDSRLWLVTALADRVGLTAAEIRLIEAAAEGHRALERRVAIRLAGRRSPTLNRSA